MSQKFELSQEQVTKNIKALQAFMIKEKLDYFYISSFDNFLNEYVPMSDCHRYYLTKFSGSVAEALVPQTGKVKVYVDGRYHEQADLEVDLSVVEVVKVPQNMGLSSSLINDVEHLGAKKIGLESQRTSLKTYKALKEKCEVKEFLNELDEVISFEQKPKYNAVKLIDKKFRGSDTDEKLKRVISKADEAYFVTAIDSVAWITNCRGYHLPHLSSFLGTALVTNEKVFVFVDPSIDIDSSVAVNKAIEFIKVTASEFEKTLDYLALKLNLSKIYIEPAMLNAALYTSLVNVFSESKLISKDGGLVWFHSIKEKAEMEEIKRGFNLGDTAIFNTIHWVKSSVREKKEISEYDLYTQTSKEYEKQGAIEQSFNTIAGVGANGSIIHYGDPKKEVQIKGDDMILLDSGGYFDGGFATDTTRTFMASDSKPTQRHREIYTLTLKGMLQCQYSIFPENTQGIVLDGFARKPIYEAGMNYMHGTGHGVGIHVHEGGVRIGASQLPMKEGQVVSIEPGIYIPGFGGVRLENIAYVKKAEGKDGFLEFEPLVYIGFEPSLIDESMLTEQEMSWLNKYEDKCKELGRSFR